MIAPVTPSKALVTVKGFDNTRVKPEFSIAAINLRWRLPRPMSDEPSIFHSLSIFVSKYLLRANANASTPSSVLQPGVMYRPVFLSRDGN